MTTLTREAIVALRDSWAYDLDSHPALHDQSFLRKRIALCDVALIGMDAMEAEPVAWQHRGRDTSFGGPWTEWREGRNQSFDRADFEDIEERQLIPKPTRTP